MNKDGVQKHRPLILECIIEFLKKKISTFLNNIWYFNKIFISLQYKKNKESQGLFVFFSLVLFIFCISLFS